MSVEVEMKGLAGLSRYFDTAYDRAEKAERFAVRDATRMARSESSKQIRSQVNFSVSYLNDAGRLEAVTSNRGKEATLTARHRATSLANRVFNKTAPFFGRPKQGSKIVVRVAKGSGGRQIKNGFFVPLRGGNVGLAVRTPDGKAPSRGAKPIFDGNAHLLYGPSVGQVAFDVFPDIAPDVSDKLAYEFIRHFERLR